MQDWHGSFDRFDAYDKPVRDSGSGSADPWWHTWATRRGAVHEHRGDPREDAATVQTLPDFTVAVVADGHGMERAFRAAAGSEFAARAAVETIAAARRADLTTSDQALQWISTEFTRQVIDRWRQLVEKDAAERAKIAQPTLNEAKVGISSRDLLSTMGDVRELTREQIWTIYGTTLLVVAAGPSFALIWQLGDGDIILAPGDAQASLALPPDPDNDGHRTTSLSQSDAERHARFAVYELGQQAALIFLATDGFANSMIEPDWRVRLGADLRVQLTETGFDGLTRDLPSWVATCAKASGDDVSAALLWHPSEQPSGFVADVATMSSTAATVQATAEIDTTATQTGGIAGAETDTGTDTPDVMTGLTAPKSAEPPVSTPAQPGRLVSHRLLLLILLVTGTLAIVIAMYSLMTGADNRPDTPAMNDDTSSPISNIPSTRVATSLSTIQPTSLPPVSPPVAPAVPTSLPLPATTTSLPTTSPPSLPGPIPPPPPPAPR